MGFGGLFGLLVLIAMVFAIIKIVQSGAEDLHKVLWVVLIILLPVIGVIIWFLAGPGDKKLRI